MISLIILHYTAKLTIILIKWCNFILTTHKVVKTDKVQQFRSLKTAKITKQT